MKIQSLAQLITVCGPLSVLAVKNITETVATDPEIFGIFICVDKHGVGF